MKTVAIIGTFDTKGEEFAYVKTRFEELGINTITIHCGVFDPQTMPDVTNTEVAAAVDIEMSTIAEKKDRAFATETMTRGVEKLLPTLYANGRFDGVFSMGGSGGTAIATAGMRKLPVGVPKVMVSTMASGDTSPYVGASDIAMFPSIVDVAGINSFSAAIFNNAVAAMAGMLEHVAPKHEDSQAACCCNHVRRNNTRHPESAGLPGVERLRSSRIPCHGHGRIHGITDQRRLHQRRARSDYHRMVR